MRSFSWERRHALYARGAVAVVAFALAGLPIACSASDAPSQPAAAPPTETAVDGGGDDGGTSATSTTDLDLGAVAVGEDVAFDIPVGALGFNITAERDPADFNPDVTFGIERVVAPDGKAVHEGFTPAGGNHKTSLAALDLIASVSVPQGDGVPESLAGQWKLRVADETLASTTVRTHVRVRIQTSGDGAFHGGALDLHIHVPIGITIGGETFPIDKDLLSSVALKERIDKFFELTSSLIGIERGSVTYHHTAEELLALDSLEKIVAGFTVSEGTPNGTQTLHVLLTTTIKDTAKKIDASGISPGVPGAAGIFGRAVSGISVTPTNSAEVDAYTIVHEMGHFFGLNHTTELDGTSVDPLSETPICSTIANLDLKACPDKDNVMFVAGAATGAKFTPSQLRVLRGSPVYRAFPAGSRSTGGAAYHPTLVAASSRTQGRALLGTPSKSIVCGRRDEIAHSLP